jgi:hypothetical protein
MSVWCFQVTKKSFKFAAQYDLDFHFVSAADGTNVVKVWQTHSQLHSHEAKDTRA